MDYMCGSSSASHRRRVLSTYGGLYTNRATLHAHVLLIAVLALSGTAMAASVGAEDGFEEGFCAPYNGKVCRSFMRSGQVWFSRVDPNFGWENEKITAGLWEEMIAGLSGHCRAAAEVCDSIDLCVQSLRIINESLI